MDRSRLTLSSLDELKQIRADISVSNSLDMVRRSFDRLQEIRRQHLDDFDLQIVIADAQQEIIERARFLRKQADAAAASTVTQPSGARPEKIAAPLDPVKRAISDAKPAQPLVLDPDGAVIPDEVPKLDKRSWQLALGLAVLFTVGIFASFFYLIQTARRLNFGDEQSSSLVVAKPDVAPAPAVVQKQAVAATVPVTSLSPTLRLYTDLTGGTASIDDDPPKDLADGELDLDALKPGVHKVRVESRTGDAEFTFALDGDQDVPRVKHVSKSINAMVVLVSVKDGTGRLNTDAEGARVSLDGKPAGPVDNDGLLLLDLGNSDHDLEVSQGHDKQKFVLTYTAAPTLTAFIKSDPSTGVLTVTTGQDGVAVFINDLQYKRLTQHGSVRIPLKVGSYHVRVHQFGFQDPTESVVQVRKSAEASVQFRLQPISTLGTLEIKGAQPGTVALIDTQLSVMVGADGSAKVTNIKPGAHVIELHHDQSVTKQLTRTFTAGQTLTLSGSDTVLDHYAADNKTVIPAAAPAGPALLPPPQVPQLLPAAMASTTGEQVHKGGGFIPYHTPKLPGRYYFQAHTKMGGVLKHGKLQWYAGYQDGNNYVLYSLDGKHAEVKEVRDGKPFDIGKIPFDVASDEWVQVEMSVKPDGVQVRAKAGLGGWTELTAVKDPARDFTKATVGMLVPSNEEVAVANFSFTSKQ